MNTDNNILFQVTAEQMDDFKRIRWSEMQYEIIIQKV